MSKRALESFRKHVINRKSVASRHSLRSFPRLEALEAHVVLSTFHVNTTLDTVAVDLTTGKDSTGHISLRSAIMAADASGGSNTINLGKGTYTLSIQGANEDASAKGDLDITGNLTLSGAGSSKTIINANNIDRVFQVLKGNVKISGVTIEHGIASSGGGILNSGGLVTLSSVVVTQNRAKGVSAAEILEDLATPALTTVTIGTSGMGGGIFNAAGSLTIVNSTISANQAQGTDGQRGRDGAPAQGGSPAGSNGEEAMGGMGGIGATGYAAFGGGIYNTKGAILTLSHVLVSSNIAQGGRGGQGGTGGDGTGGPAGAVTASAPTNGGRGDGGVGGAGGSGGVAEGGGVYNVGNVILQGTKNTFLQNVAAGGAGGTGGEGRRGFGGSGGNANAGSSDAGGIGGEGDGAQGGTGGRAGNASGGGIYNAGGGSITSTATIESSGQPSPRWPRRRRRHWSRGHLSSVVVTQNRAVGVSASEMVATAAAPASPPSRSDHPGWAAAFLTRPGR